MSPECTDYFGIAEAILERANRAFSAEIYEIAAREAYTAALNGARAIIFEKTEMAIKTHSGARTKLFELIREGMSFDVELAKFLNEGFETKQQLDYGPEIIVVDRAKAEHYIRRASTFLAAARKVCA